MKRLKRWCVGLLSLLLCFSLCGCAELDRMQAAHAVWVDEDTVAWNGYTYTLLEGYWDDLNVHSATSIFITEADVPALLITWFGESAWVNNNGTLLSYYEDDYRTGESGQRIFCRSDLTAWMKDAFINGYELEMFQYEYWNADTGLRCVYTLTAEQVQAVNTVLDTVEPFAVEEYYASDKDSVTLCGYSPYGLFVEDIGWIECMDGMYYIFRENGHEGYGWNTDCYIVPNELYTVFESILAGREQGTPVTDTSAVYPPMFFI